MMNYFIYSFKWYERPLLLLSGLMLIYPENLYIEGGGLLLFVLIAMLQYMRKKNVDTQNTQTT
ncbi:hypothetical protein AOA57_27930, partial [Pseudomonas sp. 2588-5]